MPSIVQRHEIVSDYVARSLLIPLYEIRDQVHSSSDNRNTRRLPRNLPRLFGNHSTKTSKALSGTIEGPRSNILQDAHANDCATFKLPMLGPQEIQITIRREIRIPRPKKHPIQHSKLEVRCSTFKVADFQTFSYATDHFPGPPRIFRFPPQGA